MLSGVISDMVKFKFLNVDCRYSFMVECLFSILIVFYCYVNKILFDRDNLEEIFILVYCFNFFSLLWWDRRGDILFIVIGRRDGWLYCSSR